MQCLLQQRLQQNLREEKQWMVNVHACLTYCARVHVRVDVWICTLVMAVYALGDAKGRIFIYFLILKICTLVLWQVCITPLKCHVCLFD